MNAHIWLAKLVAYTHDPVEKAFALGAPGGHEGRTVAKLRRQLFGEALPADLNKLVKTADHWAAAADRPALSDAGQRLPVDFRTWPVIRHPLAVDELGEIPLPEFRGVELKWVESGALEHFRKLIVHHGDELDAYRTALAFWRFGPKLSEQRDAQLGRLWHYLPADTRVPDHTIWQHLDLTAALATAMAADPEGEVALLLVSFGPVQSFIAQARTTLDYWAGSHILSTLAWEGMRVLAEAYGPDQIVYPHLRGIPIVDLWLKKQWRDNPCLVKGLPEEIRDPKAHGSLRIAALPNRFLAIIPAAHGAQLAQEIAASVRAWLRERARDAAQRIWGWAGGEDRGLPEVLREQVERQLADLPEVHWALLPWAALRTSRNQIEAWLRGDGECSDLEALLARFYPKANERPGFFGTEVVPILARELQLEGVVQYQPNPGVLYPAVYAGVDRALAAAKSVREFQASEAAGYRCSLCGEREWLTDDRQHLYLPPGQRDDAATLWSRAVAKHPSLSRKGEHLCAVCALKRVWHHVWWKDIVGCGDAQQFIVSTHTMALAPVLRTALERYRHNEPELFERIRSWATEGTEDREARDWAALPSALHALARSVEPTMREVHTLPGRIEAKIERGRNGEEGLPGSFSTYYAWLLFDGDQMGAWVAGDERLVPKYRARLHPRVRERLDALLAKLPGKQQDAVRAYLESKCAPSPARHLALSAALNTFAIQIVPQVLEGGNFDAMLVYAGGDDVLAMVSAPHALAAATLLRWLYSGTVAATPVGTGGHLANAPIVLGEGEVPEYWERQRRALTSYGIEAWPRLDQEEWLLAQGFIRRKRQLYTVQAPTATASVGIVIAHHQAPMGRVLRELRATEQAAKAAGRNAFALTIVKRAGETVRLALPWLLAWDKGSRWISPVTLIYELAGLYLGGKLSRRLGFTLASWLRQDALGAQDDPETVRERLKPFLTYQLQRQWQGRLTEGDRKRLKCLARELADLGAWAAQHSALPDADEATAAGMGARAGAVLRRLLLAADFLVRPQVVGPRAGVTPVEDAEGAVG